MQTGHTSQWNHFHQKEDLTTRIANILEDYPQGVGPFKEFLQNADDAKARKFSIILDKSSFLDTKEECNGLFTPALSQWQNLSLLIYNDAPFSDNDFINITSLGKSEKNEDNTRIGKYGLGFNVSYHFTDVVSFISRDQLIFFDPHGCFLPEQMFGVRMNFVEEKTAEKYPYQTAPFVLPEYNIDMKSHFPGTLMRLPLRSLSQASKSLLSHASYSFDESVSLLHDLSSSASSLLLYLKNVEEIGIYIRENGGALTRLCHVKVENITETLRKERSLLNEFVRQKRTSDSDEVLPKVRASYRLDIQCKGLTKDTKECWMLYTGSGQGAEDLEKKTQQIQWGGVAALLRNSGENDTQYVAVEGKAYAFLPLPFTTGLPIHINAFFALSSNRRTLWMGDIDTAGAGALKVAWNEHTLKTTLPDLYGDLLEGLVGTMKSILGDHNEQAYEDIVNQNFYGLWPNLTHCESPFDKVAHGLAHNIKDLSRKLFWSSWNNQWVPLSESYFETKQTKDHCGRNLRSLLSSVGMHLVDPPSHVRKLFHQAGISVKEAKLAVVTNALKAAKVSLTQDEAEDLLTFALSGEDPKDNLPLLDGLSCIPLVGGRVGVLKSQGGVAYYITSQKFSSLLTDYPFMVNPLSKSFEKLYYWATNKSFFNIFLLTPEDVGHNMNYLLPSGWHNASVLQPPFEFNPGKGDEVQITNDADWVSSGKSKKRGKAKMSVVVAPQTSNDENIDNRYLTDEQADEIRAKIRLFWEFIESAASWKLTDIKSFAQWPIINIEDGCIFSVEHARSTTTLNKADFTTQQIEILSGFGCKFASDADVTLTRLALVLGASKKDVCKALLACKDKLLVSSQEDIVMLRRCIMDWHKAGEVIVEAPVFRLLPIFKNIEGKFMSLENTGFILPGEQETSEPFARSRWHDLLEPLFPGHLLTSGIEDRGLLALAHVHPISEARLITQFLIPRVDELPESVCIKMLQAVYQIQPWRSKESNLLDQLRNLELVILPSGERKSCSHFVDPLDPLLAQVMTRLNKEGYFPPASYQKKEVIKVMQHIGMLSLRNAEGFIFVANIVAESKDLEGGNMLLDTFMQLHNELRFKFSPYDYSRISDIAFVPAFDMHDREWPTASVVSLPNYTVYSGDSMVASKKRNKKKSVNANKAKKSAWDDSDQGALDFDDGDGTLSHNELFNISIEFLREGGYSKQTYTPKQHMTTFKQCTLQSAAWACWTEAYILPASFDKLSHQILKQLSITHPPNLMPVLSHLKNFVMKIKDKALTEQEISRAQGVIHFCLTEIQHTLTYSNQSGLIRRTLSSLPFVLLDTGEFVYTSAIVFDLEDDLSETAIAPPPYLVPFERLLTIVGAPSFQSEEVPAVKIRSPNNISVLSLANLLMEAFNNPTLADLKFVVQTDQGSKAIYVHKLVLATQNNFFKTMFTAGMAESLNRSSTTNTSTGAFNTDQSDNRTTVPMPEWVEYDSLFYFLKYLYTGKIGDDLDSQKPTLFYPHTEKSVQMVCGMLRLSDMYMVEFMKEWCEQYLANPAVMTLTNVCELLNLADSSNAKQLLDVCIYNILAMLHVVMQMDQWNALPAHLKNLVLKDRQ